MRPPTGRAAVPPRPRRGAYALEFALLLPIWVMIVIAIVDFGWLFTHIAVLASASDQGCRSGALVDPGDQDAKIADVEWAATQRMQAAIAQIGLGPCVDCDVQAYTVGAPPARMLVCECTRTVSPIIGLFFGTQELESRQVARLEWQREAAP